jgi:uncharacterized protein (TIGR03643 family)
MIREFTEAEIELIIGMAWEDRTNFDAIKDWFGAIESEVIKIMRQKMKRVSFQMCGERFRGCNTKLQVLAENEMDQLVSTNQRHHDRGF